VALREVFSVDVEDEKFRSFLDLVKKYKDMAAEIPGLWSKSNEATTAIRENFIGLAALLTAHQVALQKASDGTERVVRASSGLHTIWGGITDRVGGFVTGLERAFLRLGGITGLGAGLLGVGGLYGLEEYAASAGRARRTAQGLGTTAPEMMAFEAQYSRYVNPGAFLESIAGSMTDVTRRGWLYGLGFNDQQIGTDPGAFAPAALQRVQQALHRVPYSQIQQAINAWQLPIGLDEARRIYTTPYADLMASQNAYQQNLRQFQISDRDLKRWQDLNVQLDVAGKTLWSVFGVSLSNWAPEIKLLSQTFTELVQTIIGSDGFRQAIMATSDALHSLDNYLKSGELQKGYEEGTQHFIDFAKNAESVGKAMREAFDWIWEIRNKIRGWFGLPNDQPSKTPSPDLSGGATHPGASQNLEHFNYGNIRAQGGGWRSYATPEAGIQDVANVVRGYHLDTLQDIISKYAPPSENPTAALIGRASQYMHVDPRQHLDLSNPALMDRLVTAIIMNEYGGKLPRGLTQAQIDRALGLGAAPVASASPNVQQPAPVRITLHGNTGALTPVTANAAAGGVY
jgi:hypothetical protein